MWPPSSQASRARSTPSPRPATATPTTSSASTSGPATRTSTSPTPSSIPRLTGPRGPHEQYAPNLYASIVRSGDDGGGGAGRADARNRHRDVGLRVRQLHPAGASRRRRLRPVGGDPRQPSPDAHLPPPALRPGRHRGGRLPAVGRLRRDRRAGGVRRRGRARRARVRGPRPRDHLRPVQPDPGAPSGQHPGPDTLRGEDEVPGRAGVAAGRMVGPVRRPELPARPGPGGGPGLGSLRDGSGRGVQRHHRRQRRGPPRPGDALRGHDPAARAVPATSPSRCGSSLAGPPSRCPRR